MRNEGRRDVKSNRVGRATLTTGAVTTAYRAVATVECAQCAGAIGLGEIFSRQTRRAPVHVPLRATGLLTIEPICVSCRPLRLEGIDEGL
jgi:hypothetical protein